MSSEKTGGAGPALRATLSFTVTLLAVFVLSRMIVHALPGDPIETLIAETGTSIPPEVLRSQLGLDRPFVPALVHDARGFLRGEWGHSVLSGEPVAPVLTERFGNTLALSLSGLALGVAVSLVLGLPAASASAGRSQSRLARWADGLCTHYGALAAALPTPWIGPLFIYVFAVAIPLVPPGRSIVLPAFTLAFGFAGLWCRLVRERVRDTLATGSADGARARGVPEWRVAFKYGLAPASGALAGYFGTQIGGLLTGTFITEVIFNWPGMGMLMVDAVLSRDYPVVEAAAFLGASVSLAGIHLGNAAKFALDPRGRNA